MSGLNSFSVSPTQTVTYTLTVTGSGGSANANITITVNAPVVTVPSGGGGGGGGGSTPPFWKIPNPIAPPIFPQSQPTYVYHPFYASSTTIMILSPSGTVSQTSGQTQTNQNFLVIAPVHVRTSPSTAGKSITIVQKNTTGSAIGGPVSANGYTWWEIKYATGVTGWSVSAALSTSTSIPSTGTPQIGKSFVTIAAVRVRTSPNTSSSILSIQKRGASGKFIGGPVSADGYNWWNVMYASGVTGWSVGGAL